MNLSRAEEALARATYHGLLDPFDRFDMEKIARNVREDFSSFSVADIRKLASHYGARKVPSSRVGASKALAEAYAKSAVRQNPVTEGDMERAVEGLENAWYNASAEGNLSEAYTEAIRKRIRDAKFYAETEDFESAFEELHEGWEDFHAGVDYESNPTNLRLWRLQGGEWKAVRSVTPETADQWLAVWQKDHPKTEFVVAPRKPRRKKSFFERQAGPRRGAIGGREMFEDFHAGVDYEQNPSPRMRVVGDQGRQHGRPTTFRIEYWDDHGPKKWWKTLEKNFPTYEDAARRMQKLSAKGNPPYSGWRKDWWRKPLPKDTEKLEYKTKRDALNVFLEHNRALVDDYGGESMKHSPASFDAINHRYGIKGKRRVDTIARAVWWAIPGPAPYRLEDIDVELLNETAPAIFNQDGLVFTLPDHVEEARLLELEAEYYRDQYGDIDLPEEYDFPEDEVPF